MLARHDVGAEARLEVGACRHQRREGAGSASASRHLAASSPASGCTRAGDPAPKISGMPPTAVAIIGLAGGQRLQHDVGHGLGARGHDDDVAPARRPARAGIGGRKRHAVGEAEPLRPAPGSAAGRRRRRPSPRVTGAAEPRLDLRQRVDEEVGTLQVAHHADIEEVGRVGRRRDRLEFGRRAGRYRPGCSARAARRPCGGRSAARSPRRTADGR